MLGPKVKIALLRPWGGVTADDDRGCYDPV